MKKLILLIIVITFVCFSCKKEDNGISIENAVAIKAQLSKVTTLTKAEASNAQLKLKSASDVPDLTLIEIFDLDARTYFVSNEVAIKYCIYFEIDQDGYRSKMLTFSQTFQVRNGQVDVSSYSLSYEIGCIFSQNFQLSHGTNVSMITYFFRFDSGKQFAYYSNSGGSIKLPPIADGKWQLSVDYYDGDLSQQFATDYVDYYYGNNIINVRLDVGIKNVVSTVVFHKYVILGAYTVQLYGTDNRGIYRTMSYRVIYDNGMPSKISYDAPFNIEQVYIYGKNSSNLFETKNVTGITNSNNVTVYNF